MSKEMNTDQDWLRKMAEQEDNGIISTGGLASRRKQGGQPKPQPTKADVEAVALSKLVELSRRSRKMSIEELARKADVDVAEVVSLEQGASMGPDPRTLHKLAEVLDIPEKNLFMLSGILPPSDAKFKRAAARFAARSTDVKELSKEEREALEEFVRTLVES